MFKTNLWRGIAFITLILLTVSITVAIIFESNRAMIDTTFGTVSEMMVSNDDGSLWSAHVPDDKFLVKDDEGNITGADLDKIIDAHKELGARISEEGSVLLKNETGTDKGLPLKQGAKVTLFGMASWRQGYVMGQGATMQPAQMVYIPEALKNEGFVVNQTMLDIYASINRDPQSGTYNKPKRANFDPNEPSPADLAAKNADYQDSFVGQDAAIIVLFRPGAEANDYYTKEAGGVSATSGARSALGLTTAERDIIDLATGKFSNVVVMLNTGSAMEIQEIKDNDKISSILWIGQTGNYGANGIAKLISGKGNPSGHMADIYSSNTLSSPAMQNYGLFQFANKGDVTRSAGTDYLIEAEGIYTGYKYYETRYYDAVLGRYNATSTTGVFDSKTSWKYTEEVTYGFGYGLSYTTFTQSLGDLNIKHSGINHTILGTVPVTVKNTGNKAGKSVVQLYAQAPYSAGGVEKAAIQLLAYGKTNVLGPNESQTLEIDFDLQNLVSYDSKANGGEGTYVLDAGDYYFSIGNGAHDALNNILAHQGKSTTNGMDYNGDSNKAKKWNYTYGGGNDTFTFATSKSGEKVQNQLQLADWNNYSGVTKKVKYLSRSDWSGTWPEVYKDMVAPESMIKYLDGKVYTVSTTDNVSDIVWAEEGTPAPASPEDIEFHFANMINAKFNDTRWETLLSQMTLTEAIHFCKLAGRRVFDIPSIGFLGSTTFTENGPYGLYSYIDGALGVDTTCPWAIPQQEAAKRFYCAVYPNPIVMASSFNQELSYEQGELIGNDALFTPRYVLWGPGMNTHRTPYSGRNVEYYSEDPVLLGTMGLEYAMGALTKGLIAAPKHLAFNDQDQNRKGIAPFMTEQRARENELRAFQIAFEATKYNKPGETDVGMLGCMTSFSKLGALEVNIYKELLTNIVQVEWGFDGYIVSDMGDDTDLPAECWVAGMTGYDGSNYNTVIKTENYLKDRTFQLAVRRAVKRNLYVYAQSHYMNAFNTTSQMVWQMTSWRQAYIVAISVSGSLVFISLALYAVSAIISKKAVK